MQRKILLILCIIFFPVMVSLISACSRFSNNIHSRIYPSPEAASKFISSIRPSLGDASSHYALACYYQNRGKHEWALDELNKVLIIDPKNIQALNAMGVSYDRLKIYSHAEIAYQKALNLNPNTDYVLNNLGYSYYLQGRIDDAITVFKKAVILNHNEERFHNNLGMAFAAKNQLDSALNEFKLAGNKSKAHFNIAQIYYRKKMYGVAKDHYSYALKLAPAFARAKIASKAADSMARIFKDPEPYNQPSLEKDSDTKSLNNKIQASNIRNNTVLKKKPVYSKALNIEVSNGNGINGAARRLANYLSDKGLAVNYITNADHFNHSRTMIYYRKEYRDTAFRLAHQIPGIQRIQQQKRFNRPQVDVKVVLGKDILSGKILKDQIHNKI